MTTMLFSPEALLDREAPAAPARRSRTSRPGPAAATRRGPAARHPHGAAASAPLAPAAPSPGALVAPLVPSSFQPVLRPPTAVRACAGAAVGPVRSLTAPAPRPARVGVAPVRERPARLTRRGRLAVAVAFAGVLGGGLAVGQLSVNAPAVPSSYATVTVTPGQTLWGIASAAAPGVDPRVTIDRIVTVNGLTSAGDITAGDRLSVPVGG